MHAERRRLEDGADEISAGPLIRGFGDSPFSGDNAAGFQSLIAVFDEAPSRASFRPIRPAVPCALARAGTIGRSVRDALAGDVDVRCF